MSEIAMTDAQLRAELARQVEAAGGQTAWARRYGIAPSQVCDTLRGRRDLTLGMVNALGYMRVTRYVPFARRAP